jgi:ADP-ribose pyrophosphatase YjhB (NUDIX family)
MNESPQRNIVDLLDELRAIAQTGINYSQDPFDLQRYHRIRELVSREYAHVSGLASGEIEKRFALELGYVTPKIGVQGALFNDRDELLLEQRSDDYTWGLPGGWVEVGESPEQSIRREIKEEANLHVVSMKMIGFYTRRPGQYSQPHSSIHVLYLCEQWTGVVEKSFESLSMTFKKLDTISNWHKDHQQQAEEALRQRKILQINQHVPSGV